MDPVFPNSKLKNRARSWSKDIQSNRIAFLRATTGWHTSLNHYELCLNLTIGSRSELDRVLGLGTHRIPGGAYQILISGRTRSICFTTFLSFGHIILERLPVGPERAGSRFL
jgi:hypothetical protein